MHVTPKLTLTAVAAAFAMSISTSFGSGFDLGQAGGYAALILPGGTINMDINGGAAVVCDVGVTAGAHLDLGSSAKVGPMAGTGMIVDGTIFLDTISDPAHPATVKLENQDPNTVQTRDLTQAIQDALAANAAAAALPATQSVGSSLDVTGPFTITGNGGVNVIDLNSVNLHSNGLLTLQGGPSDTFIFNISGGSYTQSSEANVRLSGGVLPQNVLWNFVGTGVAANIGGPGDTNTVGIFLAPDRSFSITDVTLTGEIISEGDLKIGSKALVECVVPEMSTTSALLIGFACLIWALHLRRKVKI